MERRNATRLVGPGLTPPDGPDSDVLVVTEHLPDRCGERMGPSGDVDGPQQGEQPSRLGAADVADMRGVRALPRRLRSDQHDPATIGQMGKITSDEFGPVGLVEMFEDVGQQDRVEDPAIGGIELIGRVRLESEFATTRHRCRIVIDPDTVAVVEREATSDPTADVEHAPELHAADVAPIRIRDELLPPSRRTLSEALGVPLIGGRTVGHPGSIGVSEDHLGDRSTVSDVDVSAGSQASELEVPDVTVVVVVFGEEPQLVPCIEAIRASVGVRTEIVMVENGGSEPVIAALEAQGDITVVRPFRNTGFAEGCNLGVAAGSADYVALINPDAVVDPDAIANLVAVAARPGVGIATASVRLADRPELLNSAGTEITFMGLSWAGHFEEPAAGFPSEFTVAAASGAGMVCERTLWNDLGGLVDDYFAYFEDAEFSIRTWQRGLDVTYVPGAIVVHHYRFSKNTGKFFLLERNRIATAFTCFETRHLVAIAPLFVVMELALIALAVRGGWIKEKMRAYWWLMRHLGWLRSRRSQVQRERSASMRPFYDLLSTSLTPGNLPDVHQPRIVERSVAMYWHVVRRLARL